MDRRRLYGFGFALLFGLTFSVLATAVLRHTHPHEDAFILFKYASMLAAGEGITYFPGGPPSEGATDFLWLVILATGVRLGADVALVAIGLNGLGAALLGAVVGRKIGSCDLDGWGRLGVSLLALSVLGQSAVLASYRGFSTLLYVALVWLLIEFATSESRRVVFVPVLGVMVGLFRPDGLVFGVGASLLGFGVAARLKKLDAYRGALFGALVLGVVYLAFRYLYFETVLPLPLLVKSHGGVPAGVEALKFLPGLVEMFDWTTHASGPLPLLVGLLVLGGRPRGFGVWATLGLVLSHLALLCFATLSQNEAFRFQAPAQVVLVLALFGATVSRLGREKEESHGGLWRRRWVTLGVALLCLAPSTVHGVRKTAKLIEGRQDYVDTFAASLGRRLGTTDTIALTEAGRLGFWTTARIHDLVGLTETATALRPASWPDVAGWEPTVVFLGVGGALDGRHFGTDRDPPAVEVVPRELEHAVTRRYRSVFDDGLDEYDGILDPVGIGAATLARFLSETPGYRVFAVRYAGGYHHVWGFRADLPDLDQVLLDLLENAAGRGWVSYGDLRR